MTNCPSLGRVALLDREGNIGDPDANKRAKTVDNHRKWLDAAKFLGCHSIRVNAAGSSITTVAGNGTPGFAGDDSLATAASLNGPEGVFVDSAGVLYIADTGNNKVRKVELATGVITTIAGTGAKGSSGNGGAATSADLDGPLDIAGDGFGNLHVADSGNSIIRRIDQVSDSEIEVIPLQHASATEVVRVLTSLERAAPAGAGSYEAGIVAGLAPFGAPLKTGLEAAVNAHLFVLAAALASAGAAMLFPAPVPSISH